MIKSKAASLVLWLDPQMSNKIQLQLTYSCYKHSLKPRMYVQQSQALGCVGTLSLVPMCN